MIYLDFMYALALTFNLQPVILLLTDDLGSKLISISYLIISQNV